MIRRRRWAPVSALEYLAELERRQVRRRNAAIDDWHAAWAARPGLASSLRIAWATWRVAAADRALFRLAGLRAVDLRQATRGTGPLVDRRKAGGN